MVVEEGIAKFDADGRPVVAFGTNGRALASSPLLVAFESLARDEQGNLYLLDARSKPIFPGDPDFGYDWFMSKFDREGSLVPSFGSSGTRLLNLALGRAEFHTTLGARGGALYVGSSTYQMGQGERAVIAKLDTRGNIDPSFGVSGVWLGPVDTLVQALALDASGNLVVGLGGSHIVVGLGGNHIARLSPSGQIDPSLRDPGERPGFFGTEPRDSSGNPPASTVYALLAAPSGDIYAAGARWSSACGDFAVKKLDSQGDVVTAFANEGVFLVERAAGEFRDIALDRQGRLYALGLSNVSCGVGRPTGNRTAVVHRLGG